MKRIIYTLACLLLSVGAWAEGNVAKIGTTEYATLADAVAAATDGQTITLIDDVVLSAVCNIGDKENVHGRNLTIDFNNHSISSTASTTGQKIFTIYDDVTLKGNGEIQFGGSGMSAYAIGAYGNVVIDGVNVTDVKNNAGYLIYTGANATVTLKSGTIKSDKPRSVVYVAKYGNFVMEGGNLINNYASNSSSAACVNVAAGGEATIKGGTLTSPNVGLWADGTLNIEGGTFTSDHIVWVNNGTANISGGDFKARTTAVYLYKATSKASISGGEFWATGSDKKFLLNIYDSVRDGASLSVTGGVYHDFNPWNNTAEGEGTCFVPDDYDFVDNGDGTFTIKEKELVAQIGETKYESLQEAMSAAAASSTVKLLADVKLSSKLEVTCSDVTLDLNGKTISPADDNTVHDYCIVMVHRGAKLTVDDSSAEKTGCIDGGTDTNAFYGGIQLTQGGDSPADAKAILVVNNGTIKGNVAAITGNGNRHNTEITINGGTFIASSTKVGDEGCAIYHPQDGTLTINGGTFTGYSSAVEMRSGTLNITDGEFTATATEFSEKANGNGTTIIGAALAVSQHKTNKDINVSISGGTFNGQKAVYEKDYQDSSSDNIAIAIYGGTFNAEVSSVNVQNFISGGTFKNAVPEEYCAVGFIPQDNGDGTYGVTEKDYVAKIGDNKYESLAEAFAAITTSDATTIEVLSDCSGNGIIVPSDRNITVNFNEHTYTVNTDVLAGSNGTKNQCFQLLRDSKVTFNNGKIVADNAAIKMIIQNYSDLTLTNMTIDATVGTNSVNYVVSNNNGNTVFGTGTTITAKETGVAFDVYSFKNQYNYTGANVTVDGATINGNIEVSAKDGADVDNLKLNLISGTVNGKIVLGARADEAVITKSETMNVDAPADYKWDADGKLVPKEYVAQIGDVKYESLSAAVTAAAEGQTITLIGDVNESVTNSNTNSFTINLNGKNWISSGDAFKNNGGTVTFMGDGLVKSTATDGIAVWARTGNIIIDGGNYENCSNEESTVYVGTTDANLDGKQPTITINGGSFKNTAEGVYKWNTSLLPLTLNIINNIANADTYQAIVVNGGTFFGNDPSVGDDSQLNKINNNSNFVNSEKHAEYKDGVFTIEEGGYKAQTGYIKYVTLDDAIDARPETETTIYLLANAETTKAELPANVTIDANGNVLTMKTFEVIDGLPIVYPKVINAKDNCYIAQTATYKRTNISATEWGTVILPFSLTSGNGATYYTFNNISGSTLTVNEAASVTPNTPVVFKKAKDGDLEINETNATVSLNATPVTTGALVGTYTATSVAANGRIYFINGDTFHKAQVSVKVPAYRAYINISSPSGAKPSVLSIMVAGNTATSIETLDADATVSAIYDASGRKISAPQKGMNIMKLANGKTIKVMMK